jgi:uncharacterized RDD family membrane protein YckC
MIHPDPYQPPQTPFAPASVNDRPNFARFPVATRRKRLVNLFLDYVGVTLLSAAFLALLETRTPGFIDSLGLVEERLLGVGLMLVYYMGFEGLFGWTPGKLATGTRVISRDGGPATFKQIAGRSFARFVPFEPLSFLSSTGGWHDNWTNTSVIEVYGVNSRQA